jgi:hypothetical protein
MSRVDTNYESVRELASGIGRSEDKGMWQVLEMRNSFKIFVGKPEAKKPLGDIGAKSIIIL